MKKYYLFLNDVQQGPFSLDELIDAKPSNDTLVWFEGLSDWKKISEVEELKTVLLSVPPPINKLVQAPPALPNNVTSILPEDEEENTILGIKKNVFYIVVAVIALLVVGLYTITSYKQSNIEEINKTTQIQNEQLEEQQKAIDEQQARIAEQEKIEAERIAKQKKQAIDDRLFEIRNLLANNYQALEEAKRKLNDVTGFKLLRTASERNEQIQAAQSDVDFYKEEIRKLEEEFNNLKNRKK